MPSASPDPGAPLARIRCGPFQVRIRSDLPEVAAGLGLLYADFPRLDEAEFVDFDIALHSPSWLRRHLRPQVNFWCDGRMPFKPLPRAQAFAMLEWGLNWVISSHAHEHLVLHAAAVERDGEALILAADPGSGKSTLCAALVHQGWRLLSDELALVRLDNGLVDPIARPISLKNQSIDVVRAWGEGIDLGPVCEDTAKGRVAHMKPPRASVAALGVPARPAMVVFPRYEAGAGVGSEAVGSGHGFLELLRHAFNWPLLATDGFEAMATLLADLPLFRLRHGSCEDAVAHIEHLWTSR